jgi:hypothetical protein
MTSSPVNRYEIHAAARLLYQGVTLRFRRGSSCETKKGEIADGKSTDRDIT